MYETAIDFYHQSLAISQQLSNREKEAVVNSTIASAFIELGKYLEALKYLEKALEILKDIDLPFCQAIVLKDLADVYYQLNRCQLAYEYCNNALSIAVELKNIPLAKECEELKKKVLMD